MTKDTNKVIEKIHLSTLKEVLSDVIKDSKSTDPKVIANFIVDELLSQLGKKGKIRELPGSDVLEFYSPYATMDTDYWEGRQLFLLED